MDSEDSMRLVRFSAVLWISYLTVLVIINQSLAFPQRPSLLHYAFLACIATLSIVLTYWRWIQKRLGQALIPTFITIPTVMPVIVDGVVSRLSASISGPLGPPFAIPEGSVLAIFPFVFVGILLVAWQYRWRQVLFVILINAGLNFGLIWFSAGPSPMPFQGSLVIILIQTVMLLVVGLSVSYLVIRLRQQQQSLEAANNRLTNYASTLESLATSRERNRLARELHDTMAHTLSGLSVQLEVVRAYLDVDVYAARSTLDKSLVAAHSGLIETRRAIQAMRASSVEDLGLTQAIKSMSESAATRANLELDLSIPQEKMSLSPDVEQCIYRIAQEAITNVMKHARAKKLTVKLEFTDGKVMLTVRDDGIGFAVMKSQETSQLGLKGMHERAQLVGGKLDVISTPGKGAVVQLTI